MSQSFAAAKPQVESYDPIWDRVRREAAEMSANEPVLASLIYATILSEPTLEDAICHTVAHRLQPSVDTGLLHKTFRGVLALDPALSDIFRADLMAVAKRDPACRRLLEPLFFFKGFVALETYRFSHALWQDGRKDFALYLQSQSSRVFARIATLSSLPTPSVVRPAAMALALAPICAQVCQTGLSFASGAPKACASGVAVTRFKNISEMER